MKSGAFESDVYSFRTFPNDGQFLPSIVVYGDMGVINAVALPKIIQEAKDGKIDMIVHVGDFAYNMDYELGARGDLFMNMVQPVASRVPYNVVVGNHEFYNNFSEFPGRFTSPGPNVFYNSFDVGPIHFIVLNSEFYYDKQCSLEQVQVSDDYSFV